MAKSICVFLILIFLTSFSGCVLEDNPTIFVVQSVTNTTKEEINSDHTIHTTFNEREISGYYSRWNGDINNTAAIEKDYSCYGTWTCDVDTDQQCKKIKPGDILLIKWTIVNGRQIKIVGSIK